MDKIGDILKGNPAYPGQQYTTAEGAVYTHAPTQDPAYPAGSNFLSVYTSEGQKLPTAIIGPDGRRIA